MRFVAQRDSGDDLGFDELMRVFQQEESVRVIAEHALLSEVLLRNVLRDNLEARPGVKSLKLDEVTGSLKTTDHFRFIADFHGANSERGCPFASLGANDKLSPLFVSFTKWASEISIRSLIGRRNEKGA